MKLPGEALARSLHEQAARRTGSPRGAGITRALLAWRSGNAESAAALAAKSGEQAPSASAHAINLAFGAPLPITSFSTWKRPRRPSPPSGKTPPRTATRPAGRHGPAPRGGGRVARRPAAKNRQARKLREEEEVASRITPQGVATNRDALRDNVEAGGVVTADGRRVISRCEKVLENRPFRSFWHCPTHDP